MRTFQLFAHAAIWRVVEVVHVTETTDSKPRIMTGRVGYRWTHAGAVKLRDRWAAAESGGPFSSGFLIQGGVIHWIPDDEWDNALAATDWNREQNVDDRAEHGPSVTWGGTSRGDSRRPGPREIEEQQP